MKMFYKNELDKDFFSLLTKFSKNYNVEEFEKLNFCYIGEIAERFLNVDLITNSEKLLAIISFLSKSSFREDIFQRNQKSAFLRNVFKWLETNSIPKETEKIIKITLMEYIFNNFDETNTEQVVVLDNLLNDLNTLDYDFNFVDVYNVYTLHGFNSNLYTKYSKNIDCLIVYMLNSFEINLENYTLIDLEFLLKNLFKNKELNILSLLNLKAKDFKKNKNNLNILKSFRQICFSELDTYKVKKINGDTNIDLYKILYLNYHLAYNLLSSKGVNRIYELLVKELLCYKGCIKEENIANEVLTKKGCYYITKIFEKNYSSISNEIILKDLIDIVLPNSLSINFCKKLALDEKVIKMMTPTKKNNLVIKILNSEIDDKEYFFKIYNLLDSDYEKTNIDDSFYFNLFEYKVLDYLDFGKLTKENLLKHSLNYISRKKGYLGKYIYISLIPLEIIKSKALNIDVNDFLLEIEKEFDYKDLCLFFSLSNQENLTYEEYKNITLKKVLNSTLELISFSKPYSFPNFLTEILTHDGLSKYLEVSKEEILDIKKMLFDSELLTKENRDLLKPSFLSEEDIFKEKENEVLLEIEKKKSCLDSYYYHSNIIKYIKDKFDIIVKSEILQKNIISALNQNINFNNINVWHNLCSFYFFVLNNEINQEFKNDLFKLVNNLYLKY